MKRLTIVVVVIVLVGLTQIMQGQVRGVPPSVTSVAPGRQFLPGPSVTSLGPRGWNHSPVLLGNPGLGHRRFDHRGGSVFGGGSIFGGGSVFGGYGSYAYAYPVYVTPYPYVYDQGYTESSTNPSTMYQPDPNYAGELGLRDPRKTQNQPASAQRTYPETEQLESATARKQPANETASDNAGSTAEPQPTTVLIFKDGHKLEVTNYVIQGKTLYNLGDEGPRKVALADLNVEETIIQNDDRGVEFKLP